MVIALAASLLVGFWAVPAQAATDEPAQILLTKSCYAAPTSCNTAAVRPYPEGYIGYIIDAGIYGCSYRVKDLSLDRVLRSGRIYFSWGDSIPGLTRAHTYRLEIYSCYPGTLGFINGSPV